TTGPLSYNCHVAAGYFETMGIPLREGREFEALDRAGTLPVVIINETMAQRYWPGVSPLGRRMKLGTEASEMPWRTIVGVAGSSRRFAIEDNLRPELFLPYSQPAERGRPAGETTPNFRATDVVNIVLRAAGNADDLVDAVQKEVWRL